MHARPLFALLLLGFAGIISMPAFTLGQTGGGKGKGGQKGMDANSSFDYYAQGQPFLLISNIKRNQDLAIQFAKEKRITNGQLNRAQWLEFQDQVKAKVIGGMGGGGKGAPQGGGLKMKGGAADLGGGLPITLTPAAPASPDFVNGLADTDFRRLDTNGDGKLNQDEMSDRLKSNLAKWDKNSDGLIDMFEYREFFRESFAARMGGGGGGGGGGGDPTARGIASIFIEEEELDRKTIVFRAGGKMPAGLPSWFKELDDNGDQDGQVALWEWRKGGKALDDFKIWDLNDDGFITPEEAVKVQSALGKNGLADSGRPSVGSSDASGRPSGGPDSSKLKDFFKKKKKDG
jgi:hypothetical protein